MKCCAPARHALLWFMLVAVVLLAANGPASADTFVFLRDNALWRANSNGLEQRQLASFNDPKHVALSPGGRLAAVTSGRDSESGLSFLYLTPLDESRSRQVFIAGVPGVCCPSFAPGGGALLLVAAQDVRSNHMDSLTTGTMSVSEVDLQGGMLRTFLREKDHILDAGYAFAAPVFAPDGKRLAVQQSGSDVSGGFSVYSPDGDEVFQFPAGPGDHRPYWAPQFLPNGQTLLCWSPQVSATGESEISLVSMQDASRQVIAQGSRPTLVEGGAAIVYERCASIWSGDSCDLWRLELREGAKPSRIITNGFAPAGRYPVR